jgi:pimeloyl-ACP methyl ester carboxylesterase
MAGSIAARRDQRAGRYSSPRADILGSVREFRRVRAQSTTEELTMRTISPTLATTLALVVTATVANAQQKASRKPAPLKKGHVAANGVDYYYEIHGKGEPLLLLHGGLGSIDMFEPDIPALAKNRQVIAVDLYGHGRTALTDRPMSPVDMGDDMAVILKALGIKQSDAMGYSLGGGVALRLAVQHPDVVRRLVLVSTPYAQSGFYPEMLPQQAAVSAAMFDQMKETPMYLSYKAIAPKREDFPRLLDKMGAYMKQSYDWSEDVKKLTMPVMLVYGDADMITLDHAVSFYHLLGGGLKDAGWQRENMSKNRLAILPNVTHYEMAMSPALVSTALPFLNGATFAPSRPAK